MLSVTNPQVVRAVLGLVLPPVARATIEGEELGLEDCLHFGEWLYLVRGRWKEEEDDQ